MSTAFALTTTPRFYKQLVAAKNPVRYCDEIARELGELVLVRGFFDFYLISHPDLVGHALLNKSGTFDRINSVNKIYKRIANIGRSGLATSEDAHWKKQRRVVAPLFTASTIRGFGETMIETAERWAERWDARSADGRTFNIKDETNALSLEVNTKCLFAADVDDHDQERLERWFSVLKEYLEAFPYPLVSEWWFPGPRNLRTRRALASFDGYAFDLIAKRRKSRFTQAPRDLVGRMLEVKDAETGLGMTDEEICHEMLTFLIAGYESTSSSLLWAFYHLSQNPDVEARVHAELDAVVGERALTMDDVPKLPYTRRVVDEVMRISPSVWFMARSTTEDTEVGGHALKKGRHLLVSIPTLHHNPAVWPDPERFDPDRFLPAAAMKRSPNAYVPFGRGPHACIGSHFALQEIVILLASLGRRFVVRMAERPGFDASDVRAGLSVYPRDGIQMRVERRARVRAECAE